MSSSNRVSTADLIYLQVNPKKLSEKKVGQVYDRLNKRGKIVARHSTYVNTVDKVWFINRNYKFVDIYIEKGKLREFIDTFKLDLSDFKNVRGGNASDIRTLSEQTRAQLDESDLSFKLPARKIKSEVGDSLEKSILDTVEELVKEEADMTGEQRLEESLLADDGNEDLIDVSTMADMSEIERDSAPFNSQVSFDVSRSMLNSGFDDSTIHTQKKDTVMPENKNIEVLGVAEESKTKTDIKLDATASIPVWRKSSDPDENNRLVEMYIRDLGRIKQLDIGKNDAWLINASLVKSNRTDMYIELPANADSDISEFIKYLKAAYGLSKVAKRRALNNIKQGSTESPHAFLSRIVSTYYDVRGETRKTLDAIEADKNQKYDIMSLYLKGLNNPKVRITIKQSIGEVTLPNLSTITRDIVEALSDDNQTTAVNMVLEGNTVINTKVDDLSKKLESLSVNLAKFKYDANYGSKSAGKQNNQNNRYKNYHPYSQNKTSQYNQHKGNNSNSKQDKKFQNEQNRAVLPPKNTVFKGSCYYCGKLGHSKRYCRKRQYDLAHPSQ